MSKPDDVRARFEAHHGITWDAIQSLPIGSGSHIHLESHYKRHFETWKAAHADLSEEVRYTDTPPTESGWYWHWDGECHRMHFVFNRPGHAYLCTEGEPYGPGQKRNFQAVQRMGGKWSTKVEPPALAKFAHQEPRA